MGGTRADIHNEIALTRARMAATVGEIDSRVERVKDRVAERVDVTRAIDAHPWVSLGIALAAGAALSLTRSDDKAIDAVVDAAKRVPELTVNAASTITDAVREKLGVGAGDGGAAASSGSDVPNDSRSWLDRLAAHAGGALADLIEPQARKLSDEMRTAAHTLATQLSGKGTPSFVPPSTATPAHVSPSAPPA